MRSKWRRRSTQYNASYEGQPCPYCVGGLFPNCPSNKWSYEDNGYPMCLDGVVVFKEQDIKHLRHKGKARPI